MAAAVPGGKQAPLPTKDQAVFKSIVKFYELKQYKKGLKAANELLKKFPEHGETLAMKGLLLSCMDQKTEAYDLVKLGIRHDIRSHVCWHVYGLLYRADHNYPEAVKCYRNALRIDPENLQILRDMSLLQIQTRDLKGFTETRRILLTQKPGQKINWIGFAVALHMNKNPDMACQVIESYEKTLENDRKASYDSSEMILYRSRIMEEMGQLEAAYNHMVTFGKLVLDKAVMGERKGRLLIKLGRVEEAITEFQALLDRNPENYNYHRGLQACLLDRPSGIDLKATQLPCAVGEPLTTAQVDLLLRTYDDLATRMPRCQAIRRVLLDFLPASHPRFKVAADSLLRSGLRKGIPALFNSFKSLYNQPGKAEALEELLVGYLADCQSHTPLNVHRESGVVRDSAPEPPTTELWVQLFLAQHYDKTGRSAEALKAIDAAITHTPTVLDLLMYRGRILKHAGQVDAAADSMERARQLDLADRYINTKCTKYLLRAGRIDQGVTTVEMFSKDSRTVMDMQCMWFELEAGQAYLRAKNFPKALKMFNWIEKHMNDIKEDQFDFHMYCLRKMTLRPYIDLLRAEDTLFSHKFYIGALCGTAEAFLAMAAEKKREDEADEKDDAGADDANLNAAQRRALRQKQKREAKKADKVAKAAAKPDKKAAAAAGGKEKEPVDEDPNGEKLADVENPVEAAFGAIQKVLPHANANVRVQLLAYQIAMQRRKFIQAARAVVAAHHVAPSDPQVFQAVIEFATSVRAELPTLHAVAAQVVSDALTHLQVLSPADTLLSVERFIAANSASLPARVAAAAVLPHVKPADAARAAATELLQNTTGSGATIHNLIAAHNALKGVAGADSAAVAAHRDACAALLPFATEFGAAKLSLPASIVHADDMNAAGSTTA